MAVVNVKRSEISIHDVCAFLQERFNTVMSGNTMLQMQQQALGHHMVALCQAFPLQLII